MNKLFFAIEIVKHIFKARHTRGFGVHSPYMFHFVRFIIYEKSQYYVFPKIESLRAQLKADHRIISVNDFGTGNDRLRKISDITRKSLKNSKWGQLLFRIVEYTKPEVIVDLGTSLGITTLYLASASTKSKCYTFEGCAQTLAIAEQCFANFGLSNVETVLGNIDQTLAPKMNEIQRVDFAFIDANHSYDAVIRYFNTIIAGCHDKSIIVLDDIHWSADMSKAWEELKKHEKVINSMDLFQMGILFFNPEINKKHFRLIF